MAYIDEIGNHYSDDNIELIQVNSKLKYFSVPPTIRTIRDFAFINSKLDVIIFNSRIESIGNLFGLRVSEIYVPIGLTEYFVKLFNIEELRNYIKEIDFPKVESYYDIGITLLDGDGIAKDTSKALEYMEYCAKNFDTRAIYKLAQYYEKNQFYTKAYDKYMLASKFLYKDAAYKKECLNNLVEQEKKHKDEDARRIAEQHRPKYLFFDTETTGLPRNMDEPVNNSANWPRLVQLAWLLVGGNGDVVKKKSVVIYPDGFKIPQEATVVHHITTERACKEGLPLHDVLEEFMQDFKRAEMLVAHNIGFDRNIIGAELYRMRMSYQDFMKKKSVCTMLSSTNYCKLPNRYGYEDYKWPKLEELYIKLFGRKFNDAHNALADVIATKECFFELKRRGLL